MSERSTSSLRPKGALKGPGIVPPTNPPLPSTERNSFTRHQLPFRVTPTRNCIPFCVANERLNTNPLQSYSYQKLSVKVAQFPEYTKPIIDHLMEVKSAHCTVGQNAIFSGNRKKIDFAENSHIHR